MRCELAPSVLSCDFGNLGEAVREISEAGAERIHFDVMDGQFVPPITFGAQMVRDLRAHSQAHMEAHLMTNTPERQFEAFVEAGAQTVIFHEEATAHAHRLAQQLRSMGVRSGIALNPATPVNAILDALDVLDQVLVMTVNPGWGGQKFIRPCLKKIEALRERAPEIDIEVDGGIDPTSLRECKSAGANVFVAGSYLVSCPSLEEGICNLRRACG